MHSVELAGGCSTIGNGITSMEQEDRNQIEKTWDGKWSNIHVNREVYQRTEEMV